MQLNNYLELELACPVLFIHTIYIKIGTLINIDLCLMIFTKVKLYYYSKEHSPLLEVLSSVKFYEVKPEPLRLSC